MSKSSFPVTAYPSIEASPIDSPLRKLYPEDIHPNGNYFVSPNGRVRYYLLGPPDGDKVVLVHGISVPSIAYHKIAPFLAEKGHRVLIYDLYGRGYSEAPKRKLETNDYIIQLALLLQYVGWNKVKVVGFSMGGGITAAFASLFSHLVNGNIVFIASAGLIEFPVDENGVTQPRKPREIDDSNPLLEIRRLQSEYLTEYEERLANDMQSGPITGLENAFKSLKDIVGLKVLIIHGTQDDIVPVQEAFKIQTYIPQAQMIQIEGADHYLVIRDEYWFKVATSIATFLNTP